MYNQGVRRVAKQVHVRVPDARVVTSSHRMPAYKTHSLWERFSRNPANLAFGATCISHYGPGLHAVCSVAEKIQDRTYRRRKINEIGLTNLTSIKRVLDSVDNPTTDRLIESFFVYVPTGYAVDETRSPGRKRKRPSDQPDADDDNAAEMHN